VERKGFLEIQSREDQAETWESKVFPSLLFIYPDRAGFLQQRMADLRRSAILSVQLFSVLEFRMSGLKFFTPRKEKNWSQVSRKQLKSTRG
jgi:hypothetical protein